MFPCHSTKVIIMILRLKRPHMRLPSRPEPASTGTNTHLRAHTPSNYITSVIMFFYVLISNEVCMPINQPTLPNLVSIRAVNRRALGTRCSRAPREWANAETEQLLFNRRTRAFNMRAEHRKLSTNSNKTY